MCGRRRAGRRAWADRTGALVLRSEVVGDAETAKRLQDHVKATIAPYKYPRSVKFTDALPKTQTGKIQRFRLRQGTSPANAEPG